MNPYYRTITYSWAGMLFLLLTVVSPRWSAAQVRADLAAAELTEKGDGMWLYFDLGCSDTAWSGYFAPHRWNLRAGGETASPAPEGRQYRVVTDSLGRRTVELPARRAVAQRWSVDLPAPGFLSFSITGDSAAVRASQLLIDGVEQPARPRGGKLVFSPFLRRGERFTLSVPPGQGAVSWGELRFHTNATGVFILPEADSGAQRFRPVVGNRIDRIFMPRRYSQEWPVFDFDGQPETTDDQQPLEYSTERFEMAYTDRVRVDEEGYFLEREFTIRERCSDGNVLRQRVRWAPLPLIQE